MAVYKRVLLKLSGEALKTGNDLFDFDQVHRAAAVIRKMADMGTDWHCHRRGEYLARPSGPGGEHGRRYR